MNTSLFAPFVTATGIIFSAIITIIAWNVNARKNREHEIFKKLLDFRIQTYNEAFKLFDLMSRYALSGYKELEILESKNNFLDLIIKVKGNINTFGNEDEIMNFYKCMETFDEAFKKRDKDSFDAANNAFRNVKNMFSHNLRKQLGLK